MMKIKVVCLKKPWTIIFCFSKYMGLMSLINSVLCLVNIDMCVFFYFGPNPCRHHCMIDFDRSICIDTCIFRLPY